MTVKLYGAPTNTTRDMLPANKGPNSFGILTLPSQAELWLFHHLL